MKTYRRELFSQIGQMQTKYISLHLQSNGILGYLYWVDQIVV